MHVDKNDYYGGAAAALNLQDAEVWVKGVNSEPGESDLKCSAEFSKKCIENGKLFSSASIVKPESASRSDAQTHAERSPSLGPPRRYSLSLSPTIIYARSALLSSLVSARVDQQIDFVASGNTWLLQPLSSASQPTLTKVPGSREDIVSDKSVDARAKRSIIKFLRFVGDLDAQRETWESEVDSPFSDFLREKFGLSEQVEKPIHALTMSSKSVMNTKTEWALRRIEGHLKSMNVLGPGFGSVVPKWGGLGEVVQVACRAQAVGGGTYVLGQGVTNVQDSTGSEGRSLMVELTSGEKVSCNWVVSGYNNIPTAKQNDIQFETLSTHSISIISRPLSALFAHPSEDSPEPASAIVNVSEDGGTPIHIVAHSSASGECPDGQCESLCFIFLSEYFYDDHIEYLPTLAELFVSKLIQPLTI